MKRYLLGLSVVVVGLTATITGQSGNQRERVAGRRNSGERQLGISFETFL